VVQCVAVSCSVLQSVRCGDEHDDYHASVFSSTTGITGCCSVLQCVVVCCSVLQCVAVCCSVCCSVLQSVRRGDELDVYHASVSQKHCMYCSLLQGVAICCSVSQCVAVCVAVCCTVSDVAMGSMSIMSPFFSSTVRIAVRCSELQ